jgi:hypothetical protein
MTRQCLLSVATIFLLFPFALATASFPNLHEFTQESAAVEGWGRTQRGKRADAPVHGETRIGDYFNRRDFNSVTAPVMLSNVGPQNFRVNTTAIGAPLVDLGRALSHYCAPVRSEEERVKIKGNTVLIEVRVDGCDWETAYMNLVEAGSAAIITYAPAALAFCEPGRYSRTRGHSLQDSFTASAQSVPMIQTSPAVAADLIRLLKHTSTSKKELHLLIEPGENAWHTCFDSTAWTVIMRIIVPFAHFVVAATSLNLAVCGGFQKGGTHCWVIFIEMFPAIALCIASLVGMYEGTFLSRDVQNMFYNHFLLSEAVSTLLVARYWRAQATAAEEGFKRGLAEDPQLSWASTVLTCGILCFDVAFSGVACAAHHVSISSVLLPAMSVVYAVLSLKAMVVCCVLFAHSSFKVLNSSISPVSMRHVSVYVMASGVCMVTSLAAIAILVVFQPLSPNAMFVAMAMMNLSRAGTGLCQLFVFLPQDSSILSRRESAAVCPPEEDICLVENGGTPAGLRSRKTRLQPATGLSLDTGLLWAEAHRFRELCAKNERLQRDNERLQVDNERQYTKHIQEQKDRLQRDNGYLQHCLVEEEAKRSQQKKERLQDNLNLSAKVREIRQMLLATGSATPHGPHPPFTRPQKKQ